MSDLVINVKQISNYPSSGVQSSDTLLLQRGGLGGPYVSTSAANLVATALMGPPVPLSLSVGVPIPGNDAGGGVFSTYYSSLPGGGLRINNYDSAPGVESYLTAAPAAAFGQIGTGDISLILAGAGAAQSPITTFTEVLHISLAGSMSLPLGTLTVARDPSNLMDVATLNWVQNNTVASFNNRIGKVQLTASDVYSALGYVDYIATQPWVINAINGAIGNLLTTYPIVTTFNGRTGDILLTLSDITCVFFQPGQQPISPTPPPTSNDNSIATTAWVQTFITSELEGSGTILASQSWVLANTVNSFNGRLGQVTLTSADVFNVGAAPLNSPNFSGIPNAPTANPGTSTAQLATTSFVMHAVAASTAGVSSFNTRTGAVTLTNADITGAGGISNPSANLTGTPTAPTAAANTNTTQIATTQFVMAQLTSGAVTSFNTRTGAVTLQLADVTGVGGAPIASPTFTGTPAAPTAAPGTNTTQLATTGFVTAALTAAGGVSSFNSRTGAVVLTNNDLTAAGGLVNPSVTLTGTPTAPTATAGTNTTQIATTQFVQAALTAGAVTSFNTRTGAITLTGADISAAGGALLAGPAFTGAPTAPTPTAGTNNTQLATTAFVAAAISAGTAGVTSWNTRTGAVTMTATDITNAGGAALASPSFTGTPLAPTAAPGTNTTQIATTAFVATAMATFGVSSFNSRTGAVTLQANDITAATGALIASPTFTGIPAAPTAAPGTNTTQLATTAFVTALVGNTTPGPFLRLAGGTVTGSTTLASTAGNTVTLTSYGSTFGANGNFGISCTPPANTVAVNTDGGVLFTQGVVSDSYGMGIYPTATTWAHRGATPGVLFVGDGNGGFAWYQDATPNAVAGTPVTWAASTMTLSPAGVLTIDASQGWPKPGTAPDPLSLIVAQSAAACRVVTTVSSVRTWAAGVLAADGSYRIADMTGSTDRLVCGRNGGFIWVGNPGQSFAITNCVGAQFATNCPNGTNNSFVFGYNSISAGLVHVSVDGGGVAYALQPVSDARMKANIAPADFDCLGVVNNLALKQFDWLDIHDLDRPLAEAQPDPDRFEPVGLIAQEVADLFPSGVQTGDTSSDRLGLVWNLKANSMLALAFGAIQQMSRSNAVLRERIEACEARLILLEGHS